jgi:branched-chain amino acid transport system permease protein
MKKLKSTTKNRGSYIVVIIAAIICLALIEKNLRGFYLGIFLLFGINAIICLGVIITNGYANIFSLGFGGIMLVSAYVSSWFTLPIQYKTSFLKLPEWLEMAQLPFSLALLLGAIAAVMVSVTLVLPAFRLRGHYFILASIGINIVMGNLAVNLRYYTNGPFGIRNIPFTTNVWWVYGILFLTVLFMWRFTHSKFGRAVITLGKDQTLASTMGIDIVRYKIYAFIIGSFIVGLAGPLWVHYIGSMHPEVFSLVFVFQIIAMLVIGSFGTISGAIIGAGIITTFTHLVRPVQEGFNIFGFQVPPLIGLIQILMAIMILLVLIYKPEGLLGKNEISVQNLQNLWLKARGKEHKA